MVVLCFSFLSFIVCYARMIPVMLLTSHRQDFNGTTLVQARDKFYECIEKQGLQFSLELPLPKGCLKAREAFKSSCRESWVSLVYWYCVCQCLGYAVLTWSLL